MIRIIIVTAYLFFITFTGSSFAQQAFRLDSIGEAPVKLSCCWKYHQGDDSLWAQTEFNDTAWTAISLDSFPPDRKAVHWFRLRLEADSSLLNIPLAMYIYQAGASEIFVDGKKMASYGVVSSDEKTEEGYNPKNTPLIINFSGGASHLIAIRYSNHVSETRNQGYGPDITLVQANGPIQDEFESNTSNLIMIDIMIGLFTGLTFLHLLLYFFYRADSNNLYYSLFTGTAILLLIAFHFYMYHTSSEVWHMISFLLPVVYPIFLYFLFLLTVRLFRRPPKFYLYLTHILTAITIILYFINGRIYNFFLIGLVFNVSFSTIFITWYAYRSRLDGAVILGAGLLFAVLFLVSLIIGLIFNDFSIQLHGTAAVVFICLLMMSALSIPISMSVYLARNFAIKSRTLNIKLMEVQQLSEQTIKQAKEKEDLLSTQNERLENQVQERTQQVTEQKDAIEKQKHQLETKNSEILDSLHYARYLQQVILPPLSFIKENTADSFILYKPKDIVAGDFYFAEEVGDYFFVAAADCTGHGVPGAMLSVLCSNALSQAVKEFGLKEPGEILDKTNTLVASAFERSKQDVNDGMDISLLAINRSEKRITWAGAYNHLWHTSAGSLVEIKGNKQPIGKYDGSGKFTTHTIPWQAGSRFYLFTDGYADQFGGRDGKKFMRRQLYDLLLSIHEKPAAEQAEILDERFRSWSGPHEQVDDVTVVGIVVG